MIDPAAITNVEWQPDKELSECTICVEKFTMLRRRHHCRTCGKLVCDQCSSARLVVKGDYKRVCRKCLADIAVNGENAAYLSRSVSAEHSEPDDNQDVAKLRKQLRELVNSEKMTKKEVQSKQKQVVKLETELKDAKKFTLDRRKSMEKLKITLSTQTKELETTKAKAARLEQELKIKNTTSSKDPPPVPPPKPPKRGVSPPPNKRVTGEDRVGTLVSSGRGNGGGGGRGGAGRGHGEIVQLQKKIQESENETSLATKRAENAETKCKELNQQIDQLKKEMSNLKDKLILSEKEKNGFEARRGALEVELKKSKAEVSRLNSVINSKTFKESGNTSGGNSNVKNDDNDDGYDECTFSPKLIGKDSYKKGASGGNSSRSKSPPPPTKQNSSSNVRSNNTSSRPQSPRAQSPRANQGNGRRKSGGGGFSGAVKKEKEPFSLIVELDKIIGQEALKSEMMRFEKGVALQLKRQELGIECVDQNPPHMLFRGNPGTGKTSIARLVGKVLKNLGVLKRGHLVEVQRSDLVAGAIGQTALKTREKINEAKGGVLFVDEAYTLAPGSGQGGDNNSRDFGREAINELMSVMNDGDPVMIFAGYAKEMESFVAQNAGLFRRIDLYFDFVDYTPLDIAKILRLEINNSGFMLASNVTDKVLEDLINKNTTSQQRGAMNGGLAKQVFRKARGHLDACLDLHSNLEAEEMCSLSKIHLTAGCKDLALPVPNKKK